MSIGYKLTLLKHRLRRSVSSILFLSGFVLVLTTTVSQAMEPNSAFFITKGVKVVSSTSFTIMELDPQFISKINSQLPETNASQGTTALSIPISITRNSSANLKARMTVYFNPEILNNNRPKFDGLHRISLSLPTYNFSEVLIPFPADVNIDASYIRVDIDECLFCTINFFDDIQLKRYDSQNPPATPPTFVGTDYQLINGAKQIPQDGLMLDLDNWETNDIHKGGRTTIVTGDDPYFISEKLDINTNNLGGLLVKAVAPKVTRNAFNFQLFYGTQIHGFTEKASSILRIARDSDNPEMPLEFLIPLNFLSDQEPPSKVLTQIRFDLPGKYTEKNEPWAIDSLQLVSKDQLAGLTHLKPAQLVQFKMQKASSAQIRSGIVKKLGTDRGFIFVYLFILAVCLIITARLWATRDAG